MQVYRVGGAVRDRLLGLPVKDCDWVVVGASVDEMLAQGYKQVGRDFPVFLHPQTREEHALARTERKVAAGYTGFEVHAAPDVSLEEDLLRRDLTINALAEDADGNLIDPYDGRADLEAGILRHVSPAFAEDPVRILRLARFAARFDFQVAQETMTLMRQMVANGEVDALVPERVWMECERALGEVHAWRFIEVLRECGALKVVMPEVDILFGVPQPERYHPEIDTGTHVLMALQMAVRLSPDTRVRFATLVHDLGKGATPKSHWPGHRGHEEGGVPIIEGLCHRLKVPNAYRQLAVAVSRFHLHTHRAMELKPATIMKVIEGLDGLRQPERFENFLLCCEADARGRAGLQEQPYPQADFLRQCLQAAQAVGREVLPDNLAGKAIGEGLRRARIKAITELNRASAG